MDTIGENMISSTALEYYNNAADEEWRNPGDYERIFRKYHVAALLGNRDAMLHVSMAYESGVGVLKSSRLALFWRSKAFKDGKSDLA